MASLYMQDIADNACPLKHRRLVSQPAGRMLRPLLLLCRRGKRSSPIAVELAAEVVQVITASAHNPESVPEPNELCPLPRHYESGLAVPAPSQSNGPHSLQQTAEQSAAPAQEHESGSTDTREGQQSALLLNSAQGQAAPKQKASEDGKYQEIAALAVPSAEQRRPCVTSLQPKALPSLSFGTRKSSSLFRQAPKASPAQPATPVPAHAAPIPSQQSLAPTAAATATSAEAAPTDKSLLQAEAGIPMIGGAEATAAELDHSLASDPADTMVVDASEGSTVKPRGALAGPGTQSLPIQSQPTKLGSMFGASKRARLGPGAAMLSVLSNSKQPARTADQVATAHLCAVHGSSLGCECCLSAQ